MRLAALPCLGVLFIPGIYAQSLSQNICQINGQAVTATGSELPDASVTVTPEDAQPGLSATADPSGQFEFSLAPGRYRVYVDKPGYLRQEFGSRKPGQPGQVLTVGTSCSVPRLQIPLTRASKLSGLVKYDEHEVCASCLVQLMTRPSNDGRSRLAAAEATTSDEHGKYEFADLLPGIYFLVAAPERSPKKDNSRTKYVPTYYPGVIDHTAAAPIYLVAGANSDNLDIELTKDRVYQVCGHVVGAEKYREVSVNLVPPAGGFSKPDYYAQPLGTDGQFCMSDVPSGSFRIIVLSRDPRMEAIASQAVDVVDKDVDQLSIHTFGRAAVRVQAIFDEGSRTVPVEEIRVRLVPAEGPPSNPPELAVGDMREVPARRYQVRVKGIPSGLFLSSIKVFGKEQNQDIVPLAGLSEATIILTLSSRGAMVRGIVETEPGHRTTTGDVLLIPDPPRRSRADLYHTVPVSQNGEFEITSVAPGSYLLAAVEDRSSLNYFDPASVRAKLTGATRIDIEAGKAIVSNLILQSY